MDDTLYLTAEERALFDKLPADVQEPWASKVEEETGEAYETDEQILARMRLFKGTEYPEVVAFAEQFFQRIQAEDDSLETDVTLLESIPAELLPNYLFCIGAAGISDLIAVSLSADALGTGDLESVHALSAFRHQLLLENAGTVTASA